MKKIKRIAFLGLFSLGICHLGLWSPSALSFSASKPQNGTSPPKGSAMKKSDKTPRAPGQYLISFEAGDAENTRIVLFQKLGVKEIEKVGSSPLYLIEITPKESEEEILKNLRQAPGVRYVEPNFIMSTF